MSLSSDQKFEVILALCPEANLRMRKPGDWYVADCKVEMSKGSILESSTESCTSPLLAVESRFETYTSVQYPDYLVVKFGLPNERRYRWNGFMWKEVNE